MCFWFVLQRKLSNKRGPPVLQNRLQKSGNGSDTVVEEKPAGDEKEGEEEKVIRWDFPLWPQVKLDLSVYVDF